MENPGQHFVGKVAQKALVVRDKKVLVVRNTPIPETLELPGGRLHVGENPRSGLARELKEELGVDFVVGQVISLQQFHHKEHNVDMPLVAYEAKVVDPTEVMVIDTEELAEVAWVSRGNWLDHKYFPTVSEVLEKHFSKP